MEDPHHDDVDLEPITDEEAGEQTVRSILDQLHEEVEDLAEAQADASLKLKVPGMKSLYIGFKYVPRTELTKHRKKHKGMPLDEVEVLASAQTLATACDCFYVSLDDGDTFEPLHKAANLSAPVTFDDQLRTHVMRDKPIANAVQTVFDLYGNDFAICDHAEKVNAWLKDTTAKSEDTLLGG